MKDLTKAPGWTLKGPANAVFRADDSKTFTFDDEAGIQIGNGGPKLDGAVFGLDDGAAPAGRGPAWQRDDTSAVDEFASAKPDGAGGGKGGGGGGGGGKGGGKPPKDNPPPEEPPTDGVLTTYTSGGERATSYNIDIEFSGTWTAELQQAFIDAAEFLSKIILGDVTNTTGGIDDIVINASLIAIDGSGGVLGRAGPTSIRGGTYLPATGVMEFDIADAETFNAQGLWDDIILHEMMHAMGFGTLWGYMALTAGSIATGDLRFTGEMANEAYARLFPNLDAVDGFDFGIPVEMDGGSGTAGGHWDDATFVNEIMTGYINGSNYLSEMTIAAFEDMGYDTVLDNPNDPNDLTGTIPATSPLDGLIA